MTSKLLSVQEPPRNGRALRSDVAQWRIRQLGVAGGLLALAGLVVLIQVRGVVPDSRLPLHIDPASFLGDLFHSWDAGEDLGHRTGSLLAYLPVAAFFTFVRELGISALGAQQLFFVAVLFFSALGMWLLYGLFWETPNQLARWAAALLYAFNPYVLLNIGGSPAGTTVLLLPYAAAPWVAVQLIRCIRLRRFRHAVFAAAIVGIAAPGVNAAVNAIFFVACGVILFIEVARSRFVRRSVLLAVWSTALFGLASLWWLAPFISSLRSGGTEFYFQTDPISLGASESSFREVLRLLGLWALYQGHKGVPYYPTQAYFASVPVLIGTMIGGLGVFASLLRTWADSRARFLAVLLVVAIPMAVSIHPVDTPTLTGVVYQWLFDSFLPFRSFRSNYKWVALIVLTYALLLPLVLSFKTSRLRILGTVGTGAFLLANMVPFFDPGLLFPPGYRLGNVPEYWHEAGRWLDGEEAPGRILFAPDQGFSVYTWGRPQGDIAPLMTERPVITSHIASGTNLGGQQLIALAGEAVQNPTIPYGSVLDLLGVGFVVQRNDVDWRYYDSVPPDQMREFLAAQPALRYERTFGMLDIYRVRRAATAPVAVSRGLAHITADGGLQGALNLFEPGTLAVFDEPKISNHALASVRASSTRGDTPSDAEPILALDGDRGSAWMPRQEEDRDQWLDLRFSRPVALQGVQVVVRPNESGVLPHVLQVSADATTKEVPVGPGGIARFGFEGSRSDSLRVGLSPGNERGAAGISELIIPGLPSTALEYRPPSNGLASFHVDLASTPGAGIRRILFLPGPERYRIEAEVSMQDLGPGASGTESVVGDLRVLNGPTTVALPFDSQSGSPARRLTTELELAPGRYIVQTPTSPGVRLRSLDVVPLDQSDARLVSLPFTRGSPESLTVDLQGRIGYLLFAETKDALWTARQNGAALERAGVGNGYANLWSLKSSSERADISFDAGGSPYFWLALSSVGLSVVAIGHLLLPALRRKK